MSGSSESLSWDIYRTSQNTTSRYQVSTKNEGSTALIFCFFLFFSFPTHHATQRLCMIT
jgi:hypothetical protein